MESGAVRAEGEPEDEEDDSDNEEDGEDNAADIASNAAGEGVLEAASMDGDLRADVIEMGVVVRGRGEEEGGGGGHGGGDLCSSR